MVIVEELALINSFKTYIMAKGKNASLVLTNALEACSFTYLLDKKNSKNHTNIFFVDNENNQPNGWQGRLCWDVPIVCTYMKIQVNRNNNYLFINKLSEK